MADKKFGRRGFLKMLGFGVTVPLLPNIPLTKDNSPARSADILVQVNSVNRDVAYEIETIECETVVTAGQIFAVDVNGKVISCDRKSHPVGIALHDAKKGEVLHTLLAGHIDID